MISTTKLFAMAAKLEEAGVIVPNVDAEVEASVSITPEEQEKIEEAITQVEDLTSSINDVNDSDKEIEELEEATATLLAISNAIKKDNIIEPQFYNFLKISGYLNILSTFQKDIVYPSVESINNVTNNKKYSDAILEACDTNLKAIDKYYDVAVEGFFDKVKATFEKWKSVFSGTISNCNAAKERLKEIDKNNIDLANLYLSGDFPSAEQIITFSNTSKKLQKVLENFFAAVDKINKNNNGLSNAIERAEQHANEVNIVVENTIDIFKEKHTKNVSGKWTLAEAGYTYDILLGKLYVAIVDINKSVELILKDKILANTMAFSTYEKEHPARAWFVSASRQYASTVGEYLKYANLCLRAYYVASNKIINSKNG